MHAPLWALADTPTVYAAGPLPDLSAERAIELLQPPLEGLPQLSELTQVLFRFPDAKLPVSSAVLGGLTAHNPLFARFEVDTGSFASLSLGISQAMFFSPEPGSEAMTLSAVDRFLVALLKQSLDTLVQASDLSVGLSVRRDEGDDDSTMTKLSASGRSLRPDGQLRSMDGMRLLFKWEEKAAGVPLQAAVDDLQSASRESLAFLSEGIWIPVLPMDENPVSVQHALTCN